MDWILIAPMLVGILAVIPGWRMYQVAYFTSRRRVVTALMGLLLPILLVVPALWIPFFLSAGKEVGPYHTLVDLLMFGAAPLGLIALLAYAADHFSESPVRSLTSGAACFALAVLPVLYYFRADQMHRELDIQITTDHAEDFSRYFRAR